MRDSQHSNQNTSYGVTWSFLPAVTLWGHYAELLVLFLSPTLGCPTQPTPLMSICWPPSRLHFCHIFFMSINLIYPGTYFKALHRSLRGNPNSACKWNKTKPHNLWLGETLYYFTHCSYSTPAFLVYISDCHAFIYLFLFYVLGILPACVYVYTCTYTGLERATSPLELELQLWEVMWGPEIKLGFFVWVASALNCWTIFELKDFLFIYFYFMCHDVKFNNF